VAALLAAALQAGIADIVILITDKDNHFTSVWSVAALTVIPPHPIKRTGAVAVAVRHHRLHLHRQLHRCLPPHPPPHATHLDLLGGE